MENDYRHRQIRLEKVHCVSEEHFDRLVAQLPLRPGQRLLDAGSAYGAVTQAVLQRQPPAGVHYHLLEQSAVQLAEAKDQLQARQGTEWVQTHAAFYNESILAPSPPPGSYHMIVAKLLWHEIARADQPQLARILYDLLAPGGRLVLWQITLDEAIGDFYRDIIRKKDALAGYPTLVAQRHFPNESELLGQLQAAGFAQIEHADRLEYHFDSSTRLATDFRGDAAKQADWEGFIRQRAGELAPVTLAQLHYADPGDRVEMYFEWGLYVAQKA